MEAWEALRLSTSNYEVVNKETLQMSNQSTVHAWFRFFSFPVDFFFVYKNKYIPPYKYPNIQIKTLALHKNSSHDIWPKLPLPYNIISTQYKVN